MRANSGASAGLAIDSTVGDARAQDLTVTRKLVHHPQPSVHIHHDGHRLSPLEHEQRLFKKSVRCITKSWRQAVAEYIDTLHGFAELLAHKKISSSHQSAQLSICNGPRQHLESAIGMNVVQPLEAEQAGKPINSRGHNLG